MLVCLLAFGLLIPQLGFYWDDWPVILMAKQGDASVLQEFYSYDRPFSYWTYQLTLPLLGADPQAWQLFTLVLRAITAILMYRTLVAMWPGRRFTTAAAALLFAVYPSFLQQNISVAYSQHFISYGLFFLSTWAMLRAQDDKGRYWVWTPIALVSAGLHLATMEYFAGLELARPLLLFFTFREQGRPNKDSWRLAFRRWAPYLLVLLGFVIWRFFLLSLPEDPNQPLLLANLSSNPVETVLLFVQHSLQNFIYVVFGPWNNTLYSSLVDFYDLSLLASIVLGGFVAVVAALYLRSLSGLPIKGGKHVEWGTQAIALGAATVFLGMLPVRITDRDVLTGLFSDRFTLPAMFGAALLWAGLARLTLGKHVYRGILIGALVGLAVGAHFRLANNYAQDWKRQARVYWQLTWRAPSLEPGTAIVGEGALSGYVSEYAAAAALNVLYRSPLVDGQVDYWMLDYYDDLQPIQVELADEMTIEYGIRNLSFSGTAGHLLFFDYSTPGQCLWVLDKQDEFNLDIEPEMRAAAYLSNTDRLSKSGGQLPYADVFGEEPEHTWCFYFEKMDLARQSGDWDEVVRLWGSAQEQGYQPNNQLEMLPLIESLVRTGNVAAATDLSLDIIRKQPNVGAMLCPGWRTWLPGQDLPPDLLEALGC
ncbi:MAG: hypothetical protein WD751_10160 [Anaerolineales bacterium]